MQRNTLKLLIIWQIFKSITSNLSNFILELSRILQIDACRADATTNLKLFRVTMVTWVYPSIQCDERR